MNTELNEAAEKYAELKKEYDILQWSYNALFKKYEELAQWQAEQKQMPTDEEIEKLAEKEYPMQSKEEFYKVERDIDFMYYDYGCMIRNDRRQFIKGFKSALQYAKPSAGAWVKASERLPEDARYYNCNFQSMPVAYWIDKKNQLIADKDGLRLDKSIWCDILWLDESALQHSDGWIDVSSKPPKAKPILLYNGHWIGVGFYKKNYKLKIDNEPKWSDETGEYITPEPTYWQPLPSPPINK